MKSRKKSQLNDELQIYRFGNGVKLVSQNEIASKSASQFGNPTDHTVGSILQLPFSFYFLNLDSATELINEEGASICGFDSVNDSLGKTLFDVSRENSARNLIDNCAQVVNNNATKIFEEENVRKDGVKLQFLSIKTPWYNNENKIVGVLGCSIVLGKHPLADSLSKITELGFLDANQLKPNVNAPLKI